ncbi:hypothetical protein E6P14_11030 [Haloarcula marismortui ATCC 43049]|uniref:Uncharacterized protein n=2 Tax=Haloarcula marismortui TaxID=2238 RepID=A0A4P8JV86_HALMA|nr:hypothetical protein C436_02232 [Haloarcula sinaiiensis ATCC 33800]QCP91353.1 hypothetical protein E6P14_11030 [Haloarcula marismortui ATCC 43049]
MALAAPTRLGVADGELLVWGVAAGGASVDSVGADWVASGPSVPSTAIPVSPETLSAARTTKPNVMTDLFI